MPYNDMPTCWQILWKMLAVVVRSRCHAENHSVCLRLLPPLLLQLPLFDESSAFLLAQSCSLLRNLIGSNASRSQWKAIACAYHGLVAVDPDLHYESKALVSLTNNHGSFAVK